MSCVYIAMIVFNNLSLKYVSVSFYMVMKSLSTVFNVVLVYVYFKQKTSLKELLCCTLIVSGFMSGVFEEKNLSRPICLNTIYSIIARDHIIF